MTKNRIENVRKLLIDNSLDSALILDPFDIKYLTGYKTNGILLIRKESCMCYIYAVDYEESKEYILEEIETVKISKPDIWTEIAGNLKGLKVAIDPESIKISLYNKIREKIDLNFNEDLIMNFRAVKDEDEIDLIRRACLITSEIFSRFDPETWLGRTEIELAAYLIKEAWQNGSAGVPFDPVVATGKNSAYPHHRVKNEYILEGWLKIDYGIFYKGYCSDLTRMYILDKFIRTSNGDEYNSLDLLENIEKAKTLAGEALVPGVKCSEIYNIAFSYLEKHGLSEYFNHGLGHGLGLDVHEKPYLSKYSEDILKEGMVVTIEPGIYFPGVGGMRVEDVYLIKKKGAEQLSRTYK